MRTIISETIAYEYSELSDAAKERVQEYNNQFAWDWSGLREDIREAAKRMFADIGLELTELEYDLYSQGGEPKFSVSGTIGADFHIETKTTRWGCDISWYIGDDDGVYDIEADEPMFDKCEEFVNSLMGSMSAAIFKMIEEEDEYVSSDEYAAEIAEANGYEYDEDGNLI